MQAKPLPRNLIEAIKYFDDIDVCTDFVAKLRWPDGPVCPQCDGTTHSYLASRRVWKCRSCKKQFSVKKGTIFEDSPIGLDKWLVSIWLVANSKNGISSHELSRSIGLTQKSAWFVLHRIRLAMEIGSFDKFDGIVEADETFVGGKITNMHAKAAEKARKTGKNDSKTIVAGTLQRSTNGDPSQVRARIVVDTKAVRLIQNVHQNVAPGATIYTDAAFQYRTLGRDFDHAYVDHRSRQYVNGNVSTNGIENFWALLKRGLHGTYVYAAPFHMHRYVAERVFTFNERGDTDLGRFRTVLSRISGRRVTYAELTGNAIV